MFNTVMLRLFRVGSVKSVLYSAAVQKQLPVISRCLVLLARCCEDMKVKEEALASGTSPTVKCYMHV